MSFETQHIESFKDLYQKRFGKKLSDQEALDKATPLLGLIRAVYRPITQKQSELWD